MAYIVMDNRVYGMTKGQPSPTTEPDWRSDLSPEGTGMRPFNPMALAVSAGATFVARGFTGDPNGLAKLMLEAIQWHGFALLEVLSPCPTFRPEQKEWKESVHPGPAAPIEDAARAAAALLDDDGFGVGVFFRGPQQPHKPHLHAVSALEEIERGFAL
jgi:2-oxoglutarate ferredoxin oxidoreductase subunit beta